jgi:hypothetical protein
MYFTRANRLLPSGGQSDDGSSSEPEDISGDMIAADQSDLLSSLFESALYTSLN